MATDIVVPTLGESVSEATVAQWLKKPGEAVAVDEPLVELETDKVTLEVNATAAGIWCTSGLALLVASLFGGDLTVYLLCVCVALIGVTVGYPLISQIYQKHYPDDSRGRLFAFTGVVRKAAALIVAALFGVMLRKSLDGYTWRA